MNNFSIISNNCWGAEVYKDLDIQYNTPFVGLFLPSTCFIKLLQNFHFLLNAQINFIDHTRYNFYKDFHQEHGNYPIAILGNEIEIHFMHYKNEEEAFQKWNRRVKRMNETSPQLFFKFCDRDLLNDKELHAFDNAPFLNKVCFTAKYHRELKTGVWIKEFHKMPQVMDGKALYPISKYYFDPIDWVKGGIGMPNLKTSIVKELRILKSRLIP